MLDLLPIKVHIMKKDKAYIFLHGARVFAAMIHYHPTLTFWGVVSSMLLRPLSIKVLYIEIFRCKLECLLLRMPPSHLSFLDDV